tara:strand:- start:326 stop:865 length:540 start_codon:yes stop_codon:yes gene_type:complete
MYNNAFFFGDSFTFGHGVEPNQSWAYHIFKFLKAKNFINLGVNGFSNESIFNSIIDNFYQIEKDDIVFIFLTKSDRFTYVEDSEFKDYVVKDSVNPILDKYWYNFIHPFSKTLLMQKDIKQAKFFQSVIPSKSYLLNRWDYLGKFETIKKASNKRIKDSHWSPKGHRDFADYIIKELLD